MHNIRGSEYKPNPAPDHAKVTLTLSMKPTDWKTKNRGKVTPIFSSG